MREIKFRAWDEYLGKFVDSSFATLQLKTGRPDIPHSDSENIALQQFTGLKDKNGNPIYEGDLIEYPNGKVFEVVWRAPSFGYWLEPGVFHLMDESALRVVGNKYEGDGSN